MEYKDVTSFINKAKKFGSRLDLTRIKKLCSLLGNPQDKCEYVHIAGTNGKGSTSIFIENILVSAGYKTVFLRRLSFMNLMKESKLIMFRFQTVA